MNGVPLRRVNQAYVIATSTKIDLSSVDVAKYTDSYFKKEVTKKKKGESEFFEAEKDVSISMHFSAVLSVRLTGILYLRVRAYWVVDSNPYCKLCKCRRKSPPFQRRRRKIRRQSTPS